jgi:phosphoenolpyruvate-protein phosphotransferase/dihydroxyacetone kinase phosphotransfer subunit
MATGEVTGGVGIVVVSHSRALAQAAVNLAAEMLHGQQVRIAIAAGLDETTFGTDAVAIKAAIEQVDSPAGVVVLMDLGSAVLSAELALDLLANGMRDRVVLCPAPLVEGLVVATVAASGGATCEEVAAEATAALLGKTAHLAPVAAGVQRGANEEPAASATFTVTNAHGLHARPAARLVSEVRRLDATVTIRNVTTGSPAVPATSLSRVATLGALQGHQVEVAASGRQALSAVDHLRSLAERNFDEPIEIPPAGTAAPIERGMAEIGPLAASAGIGIGPVHQLAYAAPQVDETPAGPPTAEWRVLIEAVAEVRRGIERTRAAAARDLGDNDAEIFDAHLLLLADPELLAAAKDRVAVGASAGVAWMASVRDVEAQWAALPDPYLRGRADDLRAVANQVLHAVTGGEDAVAAVDGVLVAHDLSPAQAAALDPARVRGVVLASGSPTSHASILIRSHGIPAVVSAGLEVLAVPDGTTVVVDGTAGRLVVESSGAQLADYEHQARALAEQRALEVRDATRPALSIDGVPVEVAANLGSVADAVAAARAGADSAGLIRTEFMFLGRTQPPSVDEQERDYRAIAEAFAGRPITIRTLDVGGDKAVPYVQQPAEANPYLGRRGIRLSLVHADLLHEQLTAICRVARDTPVNVMFPMVSTVDELLRARAIIVEAAGGTEAPLLLRVGIMVEVPAAALKISSFLPHVDFVSIGTNDLTQYTLAAERGNPSVAGLADPLDPAVLRLIAEVGRAAQGHVTVSVCGEAAADEAAIPLLLGLSVSELSVSAQAVPAVKAAVRRLDTRACAALAERALQASSAAEVRSLVAAADTARPVPRGPRRSTVA